MLGTDGTQGSMPMGALPVPGEWVALTVSADKVGLAGATVSGMAFSLYGGGASWDAAGKYSGASSTNTRATPSSSPQRFYKLLLLP